MPEPADLPPNGSAPWYVKTALYLLTNVAPLTLLLGTMLALITGWLPFPVLTSFMGLRDDIRALEKALREHDVVAGKLVSLFDEQTRTMRATCWNVAKTSEDQKRCYQ